jgi:hypothetical protein
MPLIFSGPVTGWPPMWMRALAGHLQAGGQLHEGALAAARRADDGDELALVHLQRDVLDREVALRQQLVVVGQPDVAEIDESVDDAVARLDVVDGRVGVGHHFLDALGEGRQEGLHRLPGSPSASWAWR